MPKEDIERTLPKSYIGHPVNKEAIFIYSPYKEAQRKCGVLGGSLIQFDDLKQFEAINQLAIKTNLTAY